MTNLSTSNQKTVIYYLQSEVDSSLKDLVIKSLKDEELHSIYAMCISKQNVLIAEYLIRGERQRRIYKNENK